MVAGFYVRWLNVSNIRLQIFAEFLNLSGVKAFSPEVVW